MNYIIFFCTGYALHIKIKNIRIIFASIIGALFSSLSFTMFSYILNNIFLKFFISIILILVGFKIISFKNFIKIFIMFYLVSFVIGGISFAICCLSSNGFNASVHPIRISFIASIIGFAIIQISFAFNKKFLNKKDLICDLEINILGNCMHTKAFIDSGNTLKDPYFNKNVIVIERNFIKKNLKINFNKETYMKLNPILIPYKSVSGSSFLIGIKPSNVIVKNFNGNNFSLDNVILGLCNKKINSNYSALIGINLLNNEN